MRAIWRGTVIAHSDHTVVVEGNHYFPADSVDFAHLVPSETTTRCPWKGRATYWTIRADGEDNRDAAWSYPEPLPAAFEIAGRLAFWRGVQIVE